MRLDRLPPEVIIGLAAHVHGLADRTRLGAACRRLRCVLCRLSDTQRSVIAVVGVPCHSCCIDRVQGITESVPSGCYAWDGSAYAEVVAAARALADQEKHIAIRTGTQLASTTERLRAATKWASALGYGKLALRAARLYRRAFASEATARWLATNEWYAAHYDMQSLCAAAFYALDPLSPRGGVPQPIDQTPKTHRRPTRPFACCASMLLKLLQLFGYARREVDFRFMKLPAAVRRRVIALGSVLDGGDRAVSISIHHAWDTRKAPTWADALFMLLPPSDVSSAGSPWACVHADCLRDAILARVPSCRRMRDAVYSGCHVVRPGAIRSILTIVYGDGSVDRSAGAPRCHWPNPIYLVDLAIARGVPDDLRALLDTSAGNAVLLDYGKDTQQHSSNLPTLDSLFSRWLMRAQTQLGLDTHVILQSAVGLWYVACELAAFDTPNFCATLRGHLLVKRPFELLAARILGSNQDYDHLIATAIGSLTRDDILELGDAMGLLRPRLLQA